MPLLRSLVPVVLVSGLLLPAPVLAQQSISVGVGGFVPLPEDSRAKAGRFSDDVLVNNLDFLDFDIRGFRGPTLNVEYLVGLGEFLEAGLGAGVYARTVPSVYADLVNRNGREIEQSLKLRIAPVTATLRFLPLGRPAGLQPYVGAGVAAFSWRYSESGDFVDPKDNTIYRETYVGTGTTTGAVILGGIRVPLDAWDAGFEVRHHRAIGHLPADQFFAGDKIDLGGWSYMVTFSVHF